MHKPESLHYGRCPKCRKLRVCVLLHRGGDQARQRSYYIRAHECGRRLLPLMGSLKPLRNNPQSAPSPIEVDADHRSTT